MPARAVPRDMWSGFQAGQASAETGGLLDSLRQKYEEATAPIQQAAQSAYDALPAMPSLPSLDDLTSTITGLATPTPAAPASSGTRVPLPGGSSFGLPSLDDLTRMLGGESDTNRQQPPATASTGVPVGLPQISAPPAPGEIEAYIRQSARARGIDPDRAVQVALSEGGLDDPVRQSDVVYQGQREQSYGPLQLNVNGGVGSRALEQGIDPRNPAHWRAAIDFALDEAARSGWDQWHGAARVGIGSRDGLENARPIGASAPTGPQPTTPPQAEQTQAAQGQAPTSLQGITPDQFGLGDADAEAICGPVLLMAFARANGRNPTIAEAKQIAAQSGGWTSAQGMGGPEATARALRDMGVPATYKPGALDVETIRRETQNGNPVGINTAGHYFVVEGVDAEGRLNLGASARALRASGGRTWFKPEEIAGLGMGAPTGAIYKDAPSSPTPSVAVKATDAPMAKTLNTAPGAPSPDAQTGGGSPSPAAAGTTPYPPSPWEQATGGGPVMMKQDAGSVPVRDSWATDPAQQAPVMTPGDGGTAPIDTSQQPYNPDDGPHEATPGSVGAQPLPQTPNYPMSYGPVEQAPAPLGPEQPEPTIESRAADAAQAAFNGPMVSAAVKAAQEAYNDPVWQAFPAPARAVYLVSQAASAFGDAAAREVAKALGVSDEELFSILGHPVSGQDMAGFAGSIAADPTNYVGLGAADPLMTVARGAFRDVAPEIVQRAGRAAGGIVREGADALGRGLQGVGREIAGGLMDLNPVLTPRMADAGPGIGRALASQADEGATIGRGGAPVTRGADPDALVFSDQPILAAPRDPHIASNVKKLAEAAGRSPAEMTPDELYQVGLADAVVAHERARNRIPARAGRRYYHVADPSYQDGEPLMSFADMRRAGREVPNKWEDDFPDYPKSPDARSVTFAESYAAAHAFNEDFLDGRGVILAVDVPQGARLRRNGEGYVMKPGSVPAEWVSRVAARDFVPDAIQQGARAAGSTLREGAEALGRGLQGAGREVAGGLLDLQPGLAPRVIGDGGPGIGRALASQADEVPAPHVYSPEPPPGVQRRAVDAIPPESSQSVNISSASDVVDEVRRTGLTPPSRVVEMIGDRPDYLPGVAQVILDQRRKVVDGTMTPRDVAKAYYMTVASQGADAIKVSTVEANVPGFKVPEQFWAQQRAVDGSPLVRPEEAAAAWLFTPKGQQALDDIERGVFNADAWADGAAVRRAFGDDRFRTTNIFGGRAPVDGRTKFNMTTLQAFTDQFNDLSQRVARGEAPLAMLDRFTKRLNGVREAKAPFILHALGFGESPTIDAVEINTWLTGHGDISRLKTKEAEFVRTVNSWLRDPRVGAALRDRITGQFDEVRQLLPPETTADLPPEVFNHVLHHWIWDRMKGIETTHEGFYNALRNAATPGVSPGLRGSGVGTQLATDLGNSAGGGVGGAFVGYGLPADTEEERRQNALRGAGIGMVGGPLAGRAMRRAGGALATPGVGPQRPIPKVGATPEQVAAEVAAGAREGAQLNQRIALPGASVPRPVRVANAATDDRAAMRWAEDMLTDMAGSPRLTEMDARRPSTLSRLNASGVADGRIDRELAPAVELAAENGLQHELPQYLRDLHMRDIMQNAYADAAEASRAAAQPAIDDAKKFGANPVVIARMEARADAEAEKAGTAALRRVQTGGRGNDYAAVDARVQAVEQRVGAAGKTDALQESAQGIWDHNRATIERLRDAGLITQDDADAAIAAYPHGVPTTVVTRLTESGAVKPVELAEAFGTVAGEAVNPIVASRIFTLQAERAIQRNNVMRAFGSLVNDAVDAGELALPARGAPKLWGGGVNVTFHHEGQPVTFSVPKAVADGLESAANMGVSADAASTIWKRLNGLQAGALTAARASFIPVNLVRDAQDYAIKTAVTEGGPQKIPAAMLTYVDEAGKALLDLFASNVGVRSVVGGGVGSVVGVTQGDPDRPVSEKAVDAAKGFAAGAVLLGANKTRITGNAGRYLETGGGTGAINAGLRSSERWYRDALREGGMVVRTPADLARYLGDWGKDILSLQGIKAINQRTELVTKTAAMRRAEARGVPATEAIMAGRDVTYDPERAGTVVRSANGIVKFLNATVQNTAQMKRLWQQNPRAAAATIVTTVGLPMLALEAWNRRDPETAIRYDDVPQSEKDAGLILMLPPGGSDARGEKNPHVMIPTGWATPVIAALRSATQHLPGLEPSAGRVGTDPEAGAAWNAATTLMDVLSMFSPIKGDGSAAVASNFVPTGVSQAVELGLNKSLYNGAPIVSPSADERATTASRRIAEGANALGRGIGNDWLQEVKPSAVDYLARQLPSYGDIYSGASDMYAPSAAKQQEDRPVANQPFFGGVAARFARDTGGANLTRAQDARLPEGVRSVLEDAALPPSTIAPVPTRYKGATLTRDEQQRWQEATNAMLEREILRTQRSPEWRARGADHEKLVKDAAARARDDAAARALRRLTDAEIERRMRREKAS